MEIKSNKELTFDDRAWEFHSTFGDFAPDATYTLIDLVLKSADYLGLILGKQYVERGMAEMCGGSADNWRQHIDEIASDLYSEWPMGIRLHNLAAYAYYGIVIRDENDSDMEAYLAKEVREIGAFLDESPIDQWLPDSVAIKTTLEEVVSLARNRWALDCGESIEPGALAFFGQVSEARVRNLMAGRNRKFKHVDGRVTATDALKWLADRDSFYDSIWRTQSMEPEPEPELSKYRDEPLFLPVARDGSIFHPGLKRTKGFQIGPKGNEEYRETFKDALSELQRMQIPYWRRPNQEGIYGIVRGTGWERYDQKKLEAIGLC